MTIAKVINIGAEQLIALPTAFHIDADQVNIQKHESNLIINISHDKSRAFVGVGDDKDNATPTDFYHRLMQWREENEAILADDDPWAEVRSRELGRDLSWED